MGHVKRIPFLPPEDDELEVTEGIGALKAYALNTGREEPYPSDIHEASLTRDAKLVGGEKPRINVSTLGQTARQGIRDR